MSTVPQRLGKYELRQQLGRGSVGEVWKGYDLQLQRDVAVKIVHTDLQSDPDFFTHFIKEGKAIASLHHTNIVQVQDVTIFRPPQESSTTAAIIMEYIEGQTLADFIQETSHQGQFPSYPDIVYLFTSLGVAIDYAHQKGIIHGNIKPSNILLYQHNSMRFAAGEPMLTDFGQADLFGYIASVASPHYMSPEQARGEVAGMRSDIYSLGVLLYELCTGVQPFRDPSSVAVMMQHIDVLPTPPILINANIPPKLSEVILRTMAKEPATRFAMASLLAAAIADACSLQRPVTLQTQPMVIEKYRSPGQVYTSILGVSQPLSEPLVPLVPSVPSATPSEPPAAPQVDPAPPPRQSQVRPNPPVSVPSTDPVPTVKATGPVASQPEERVDLPFQPSAIDKHAAIEPVEPKPLILPVVPKTPTKLEALTSPSLQSSARIAAVSSAPSPLKQERETSTARLPVARSSRLTSTTAKIPVPAGVATSPACQSRQSYERLHLRGTGVPLFNVVVAMVLLLLVIGSAIIASLLLNHHKESVAVGNTQPYGQVFFQDDALGHDDMLRVDIKNVPPPQSGKTYVAWLLDASQHALPLGPLSVSSGTISFVYPGDNQHTNLLSIAHSIIITQENSGSVPGTPQGKPVFSANVDSATFQSIKNILYSTPGLPGNQGVVAAMLESIKSLNDKAGSIVDTLQNEPHDYALAHRQAIRIIEMADGTQYAMHNGDLPANDPSLSYTRIGLLSSPTQPGYIDTLSTQLDRLQAAAGNNPILQQHIQNIRNAITDLKDWVQKIRSYDVQILKAADLSNPMVIGVALQLKKAAADSYTGRTIPPNEGPLPTLGSAGAYQAYVESQYMATLNIQ